MLPAASLEDAPRMLREILLALLELDHLQLHLLQQPRPLDGRRQLIGHNLHNGDIVLGESFALLALNIDDPDDSIRSLQREGHFRVGLGKQWIIEIHRVHACVQGNARLARRCDASHNSLLAHTQTVLVLQHLRSLFRGRRAQHCVFLLFIKKEDAGMV